MEDLISFLITNEEGQRLRNCTGFVIQYAAAELGILCLHSFQEASPNTRREHKWFHLSQDRVQKPLKAST